MHVLVLCCFHVLFFLFSYAVFVCCFHMYSMQTKLAVNPTGGQLTWRSTHTFEHSYAVTRGVTGDHMTNKNILHITCCSAPA